MYSYLDLENMLKTLDGYDILTIDEISISKKCFGNIIIRLHFKGLQIKLISEKNNFWCELGFEDEMYFCEDIFSLLNINIDVSNDNFLDYAKSILELIIATSENILNLFSSQNLFVTKKKLRKIGMERARKLFEIKDLS